MMGCKLKIKHENKIDLHHFFYFLNASSIHYQAIQTKPESNQKKEQPFAVNQQIIGFFIPGINNFLALKRLPQY